MNAQLKSLTPEECLTLLRGGTAGGIALVLDDGPVIIPVNFRLVEPHSGPLIVLRTRPEGIVEESRPAVAFETDGVDLVRHRGWSVLVRGDLVHACPNSAAFRGAYDPEPWLSGRDSWLLIDPWAISGREIGDDEQARPAVPEHWPVGSETR